VVLFLIAIGLIAATLAVIYWRSVARAVQDGISERSSAQPAWNEKTAEKELTALQEHFNQTAVDKGDPQADLAAANQLVERYPRYASAHTLLAQVLMYQGQLAPAYDQLILSLGLDPNQAEVSLLAGTLANELGRVDEAVHQYSTAVGLNPTHAVYRLHLAQGYWKQNKIDKARGTILEALKIDSSLHEGYAMLCEVYAQQNKLSLALSEIDKAIAFLPAQDRRDRVAYTRRKSQLIRRDNKPDEALLTLRTLTPIEQMDPAVLDDMAVCWSMLGQPEKSAGLFEDALVLSPTQWPFAVSAARWRLKSGDLAAAERLLAGARRINPGAPQIAQLEEEIKAAAARAGAE
jgi:tetratricopeptide (TPR) repeat protein